VGKITATDGEGRRMDATTMGLATAGEGLAVETVDPACVEDGAAGDAHAPAARLVMRKRIVGRGTTRIPARARVTG
jgi:hypothetical protein